MLLSSFYRRGKHLTNLIREQKIDVEPISEEEVAHYSALFNQQMIALRGREGTNGQNFYRLFKNMDVDGSGRISFHELAKMVREDLKVTREKLPKEKLMGLWKVLDDNESGFICAGECVPRLPPPLRQIELVPILHTPPAHVF